MAPAAFKKTISLKPNVWFTSNQAVNSSLSLVYRTIKQKWSMQTMKKLWKALFDQKSLKIRLAGSIWWSIKVQEPGGFPKHLFGHWRQSWWSPNKKKTWCAPVSMIIWLYIRTFYRRNFVRNCLWEWPKFVENCRSLLFR